MEQKDKMASSIKSGIIKALQVTFGLLWVGIGTALLLSTKTGSSTMGMLSDGIHHITPLSIGVSNILVNAAFLAIVAIVDIKLINVGTLLTTALVGVFIDLTQKVLAPLRLDALPLYVEVPLVILGLLLLGFGLGFYVSINFGMGPYEGIVTIIHKKTGFSFKRCKQFCDLIMVVASTLMGATLGYATILSVLFTGPIMQRTKALCTSIREKHAEDRIESKVKRSAGEVGVD